MKIYIFCWSFEKKILRKIACGDVFQRGRFSMGEEKFRKKEEKEKVREKMCLKGKKSEK